MVSDNEAKTFKALKVKVYTSAEQIQDATIKNLEFLETTKHSIQLQFSQQERRLIDEIRKTDADTRSVVL